MEQSLKIADIKSRYPDEWLLLGNPVMDENEIDVVAGTVIYHSKDKKEVCYLGRDKTKGYETITLIYTGKFRRIRKITGIFNRVKMTDNLMENKHLTSFADHLDEQYGKPGTDERNAYEKGFETFMQEVIKSERTIATIDPALNEYTDKIMSKEKYKKAKKFLRPLSCRRIRISDRIIVKWIYSLKAFNLSPA